MTLMKAKEFRNLSEQELSEKLSSLEKDLFDLRQKKVTGQLDKPHRFKEVRRQIAQINTVKNELKKER